MKFLDYDLDRFTKALNIQGFEFVCLIDEDGSVLAEKSVKEFDFSPLTKDVIGMVENCKRLAESLETDGIESITIELKGRKAILGISMEFIIFGIPSNATPLMFARNEVAHAVQSLM